MFPRVTPHVLCVSGVLSESFCCAEMLHELLLLANTFCQVLTHIIMIELCPILFDSCARVVRLIKDYIERTSSR